MPQHILQINAKPTSMKRLTILTTFCIAVGFLGRVQAQGRYDSYNERFTNATALLLKPYADSLNAMRSNAVPIPAFMQCACIDAHPPVFAGFHGSFRWAVLQQVANKQLLFFLLHAPNGVTGRFKAVCTKGRDVERLYGNKSFYSLMQLRYAQLIRL